MPIARNAHFTGRDGTLLEIQKRLSAQDEFAKMQILHGPGGIGKTQTAGSGK